MLIVILIRKSGTLFQLLTPTLNPIASIRLYKSNFLNNLRKQNPDRLIISHLNVNSLRNKFEFIVPLVKDNIDISMLSETKLDSSFPHVQFNIEGYSKPYRLDRARNGGGLILFIREGLPSKLLSSKFNSRNKEYFLVEINLRKRQKQLPQVFFRKRCS